MSWFRSIFPCLTKAFENDALGYSKAFKIVQLLFYTLNLKNVLLTLENETALFRLRSFIDSDRKLEHTHFSLAYLKKVYKFQGRYSY